MKVRPLYDRILVKRVEEENKTAGGLFIPDTAKEKPQKGEVVAVGDGRWDDEGEKRVPMDVKVGDTVIYKEWGKTSIKIEGDEYFIMSQNDILAIVQD